MACAHRPPKPWPGSPRASGFEGHFSARDFGGLFRNTGRPSESPPLCAQGASALGHVLTSTDSSINRCDLLEGRWRLRHTSRGNGGRGCPTAGKWWCDDMVSTGSSAAVGPQRRARTSTLPWHGRSELITRAAHNYTSSITPPGFEAWRTDSIRTPSRHIPRQIAQGNPAGDAPWFRQFGSSVCPLTVTALPNRKRAIGGSDQTQAGGRWHQFSSTQLIIALWPGWRACTTGRSGPIWNIRRA